MKFKYVLIASLMLAILMVGAVSATDTISEDIVSDADDTPLEITDNDVYTTKESSFSNLSDEIENAGMSLDLNQDYAFNNETDNKNGIVIGKDNFVLNGNGRTIDAKNQSRIFNITANNVTLSNLILTGGNAEKGGAIYARGSLTLNNVTFINNYAKTEGGAVGLYGNVTLNCDNTDFTDNYAEAGSAIYVEKGKLNLYNAEVSSKIFNKYSQIAALRHSVINIENATFANSTSSYSPAMYLRNTKTSIINSKFYNLRSDITAGAIGVRAGGEIYIKNCEFINTTSSKNAGAVYADIAGEGEGGYLTIIDTVFKDTYSDFGGALLQLGGDLFLNNTEFTNNHATYNGGSLYLSYVTSNITNCNFTSNGVSVIEGYPTYGGAIFNDMGNLNVDNSRFINNTASAGSAIYAYDSAYTISNSIFKNNTNPIYSVFDKQSNIEETNIFINDNNISTNNTFYATIIIGEGMQLTLINNTINATTLPARYDSRDWGWVSPVKAQGWMGSCWTFGMTGALESALSKATGLKIDLSENNMQDTMIKYSIYGETEMVEGAINTLAASYLLSWFGAFTENLDSYDEMGKISPVITTTQDIHVQDVIFIANDEVPNGTKLKEAIMKYGSINVNYYGQSQYDEVSLYYNTETCAQYVDVPTPQNHAVTVVGWDDNFPKEKFLSTPPGDGAWIVKNSWGPAWGENGYLYVSYYDQSFVQCGPGELNGHATAVILENTVPYNKNYQYVVAWDGSFLPGAETVSYMNVFEALDDDLIAAVGTFFQEGGDNYTVEIYVNDELKLTQNGVTPYIGYHTIKLNEYIPVKEGDVFKAVITTKNIPFMKLENMRTHYTSNISFVSIDGAPWIDSYNEGVIAVLKVYTVANPTFSKLQEDIANSAENHLDLYCDYEFNNETDNKMGILIDRDNFVLNGNGHTIDAKNQSRIFNITANNVTLSNLILTGGNAEKGGAIYTIGSLTLNNITFIDNYASKQGAAVGLYENVTIKCDNSRFIDNYAVEKGSAIYLDKGELDLSNTNMTSKWVSKSAQITAYKNAIINIQNAIFADTTSTYCPALYIQRSKVSIIDSKFNNLKADITAGAISLKECGEVYIENCNFTNVTSSKNGGAINADIWGDLGVNGNVTIIDTIFKDTSSEFGGAYLQLGGNLFINNTIFTNNHATYNGGSLYISYVTSNITNCNFTSNGVDIIEGYPTYGGAIFNDMGTLNVDKSNFINNTASAGNAICAYDSSYNIKNSLFENNTNPIYTFFDKVGVLENNVYINDDNVSTNNEIHSTIVIGQGMQLTLLNNTINVTNLPARFDLRDWGWVSPVRDQGWMGACWTFGMTGALESVILKAAGITSDFSENNMKDSMYRYSIYGDTSLVEGGNSVYAISYLVSWLGALIYDADVYDEMGKISPVITTLNDVHVQDAIFIPNNEIPNGTKLKEAIIKYGSLAVSYYGQSTYDESNPYYNETTYAQYVDKPLDPNHAVSIVGWDDNFPKENFLITPPGDGAWIVKNSWGPGWGDNGFLYVSYYDQTLLRYDPAQPSSCAATVIFENTVPYNKNYQYAIIGGGNFMSGEKNISYMNVFEALDDDLIAAVGTYFNQEGVNYTVEIYVNDELRLTQKGVSPFFGYHTIKLDDYISIKKGDVFKAIITSNAMPYIIQPDVRVDYTENISFFSIDGAPWADSYKDGGAIVCLKVYTVADDSKIINNKNIAVDYDGSKYFSVNVVTADGIAVVGASVKFNINGKTTTVKTNGNGIAKIKITDVPKKYTITTTYKGKSVKNTVTVKQVLTASKVTVKKTAKSFTLKAKLKINGKLQKGKVITFKFNGKTYKVKTNAKGIAQKTLTKKVINKLKKGKTYTVKITYKKDTIKTTVKVK